jgi:hypothetical protein
LIATSTAQNDSGVFELNFRDERYLPFEGTGAISTWEISLPGEIRQFDLNSINDIILHFKYTANYNDRLVQPANKNLHNLFKTITEASSNPNSFLAHVLNFYTSSKHEHSADWFDYDKKFTHNESTRLALSFKQDQFPFFTKGRKVTVKAIKPAVLLKSKLTGNYTLSVTYTSNGTYVTKSIPVSTDAVAGKLVTLNKIPLDSQPIVFQQNTKVIQIGLKDSDNKPVNATQLFEDMIFVLDYIVEEGVPDQAANDKPEYDLNRKQLVAWWSADEAQNTFTQDTATLHDKSGHEYHLQDLGGWNGAELPELKTTDGIQYVQFSAMSGMVERTSFRDTTRALETGSSFTVIHVANGQFGLGINGSFNDDNNNAYFNMSIGRVDAVLQNDIWNTAILPYRYQRSPRSY